MSIANQKVSKLPAKGKKGKRAKNSFQQNLQKAGVKLNLDDFSADDIQKFVFGVLEEVSKDSAIPIKDVYSIPDENLEGLYSAARNLYENARYDEAKELFRLLVMIDQYEKKYVFALAATLQMQHEYFQAATTYTIAATLVSRNPTPHFHAAECYLALNEPASACVSLGLCIRAAGKQPEFQELKERCSLARERLLEHINKVE